MDPDEVVDRVAGWDGVLLLRPGRWQRRHETPRASDPHRLQRATGR